jgi:cytochrome oxidase assembly protein ShyY1
MPLWLGWTIALLAASGFAALGAWQAGRAVEKDRMLADSADVLQARRPQPVAVAFDRARADAMDWIEVRAGFAARAPVLLDNQQRDGRVGVRVYRIAYPETGGELLVDLGWLPMPGDRRIPAIPSAPVSDARDGRYVLRGLMVPPPSAGLRIGPAMLPQPSAAGPGSTWLATRIDIRAIDTAIGHPERDMAPRVLRLDPAVPIGFDRDLRLLANTLPPEKHRGYAVQWFGLALTVLAIALVLTFRKPRR